MAKYAGVIGYAVENVEKAPGVWEDTIVERKYRGDVIRNARSLREVDDKTNMDISVENTISIVADAYAYEHFFAIRYVSWAGTLWTVSNVVVESPRLLLRLGGVYNGQRAET